MDVGKLLHVQVNSNNGSLSPHGAQDILRISIPLCDRKGHLSELLKAPPGNLGQRHRLSQCGKFLIMLQAHINSGQNTATANCYCCHDRCCHFIAKLKTKQGTFPGTRKEVET